MPLTPKQQATLAGWRDQLGRWEAARYGLFMNRGSWLCKPVCMEAVAAGDSRGYIPIAQGYRGLYYKHYRIIWAAINEQETK